jgi:hypothetical protein
MLFIDQLKNFGSEASWAAQYCYSELTIRYAIKKSEKLLSTLNRTPLFWTTCFAGTQTALYILLARVFDSQSNYNIVTLLDAFEEAIELNQFSRDALAERKKKQKQWDPKELADYLDSKYDPKKEDVKILRERVGDHRKAYERFIKPARNKSIAHREMACGKGLDLFTRGTYNELCQLVNFLSEIHIALLEQYNNGNKPDLPSFRYSIEEIYNDPHTVQYDTHGFKSYPARPQHELVVQETKKLIEFIERGVDSNV